MTFVSIFSPVVMDSDHFVDFEGRHLVDLVNHLGVRKDNQKDYLVDNHCMLDDLLQDDTFDYTKNIFETQPTLLLENSRVDIDKEIFEEHSDVDSFQEDSFHQVELQAVVDSVQAPFVPRVRDRVDLVVNHLALSLVVVYHFGLVVLVPDFGLVVLTAGLVALSVVCSAVELFLPSFLVLYFQILLVYFLLPFYLNVY